MKNHIIRRPNLNWIDTLNIRSYTIIFASLLSTAAGIDMLQSYLRNYQYYWSESILFNTFWLLFLPLLYHLKSFRSKAHHIILTLIVTLLHLMIFSSLVNIISAIFLDHTFNFYPVLLNSITEKSMICVIIYGLINYAHSITELTQELLPTSNERIVLKLGKQRFVVNLSDILYIKSEKPYISIITKQRKYLSTLSLKQFLIHLSESRLNPNSQKCYC